MYKEIGRVEFELKSHAKEWKINTSSFGDFIKSVQRLSQDKIIFHGVYSWQEHT
jgi:hypothetical protein